jgi:cell division protein FtsL
MTMSKRAIQSIAQEDPGIIQKEMKRLEAIIRTQKTEIEDLSIQLLEATKPKKRKPRRVKDEKALE